jgi:hypothetical protein
MRHVYQKAKAFSKAAGGWVVSCFEITRLTNAFSKKFENHCHMAIYHVYYNFCRVHQTLRLTPAMEAGLTDHVWTVPELVAIEESATKQVAA